MKKLVILLCVMLAAGGLVSLSAQNSGSGIPRYELLTQDARIMGMGGAFTAVADDYNALLYNPAGLAFLNNSDLVLGTTVYSLFNNKILDKLLADEYDDDGPPVDLFKELHIIPRASFVDRGWGVAAISRVRINVIDIGGDGDGDDDISIPFTNDLGLMAGLGLRFGPLSVGGNVRLYKSINDTLEFSGEEEPEFGEIIKSLYNFEQIGDAEDNMEVGVGAMFTIGSISVGGYIDQFLNLLDYEDHIFEQMLKTANVGISFTPTDNKLNPRPFNLVNLIAALDINNIGDDELRSINVGSELGVHLGKAVKFDFRAGYRQGIPGELDEIKLKVEEGEAFFGLGAKFLVLDLNAAVALPAAWIQDSIDADKEQKFADYTRSPRVSISGGIRL